MSIHRNMPFCCIFGLALFALCPGAHPQEAEDPAALQEGLTPTQQVAVARAPRSRSRASDAVSIGGSIHVKEKEAVRDLVVVGGSAIIDGTVEKDAVVVVGALRLGPNAKLQRDLVVVAGLLDADPAAHVLGSKTIIGLSTGRFHGRVFTWVQDWFNKGLLFGRPLVPQYGWTWALVGICLAFYLFLTFVFPQPVRASLRSLEEAPGTTLLVGLLVFLLAGPLLLLCVITVIGIPVVPLLLCALIAAFLFGKVALCQYAGLQLHQQTGLRFLSHPPVALTLGVAIFSLCYVVPVIGFVAWGLAALLAFGASVIALFRCLRSETPKPSVLTQPGFMVPAAALAGAPAGQALPVAMARVGFWWRFIATLLDFILIAVGLRLLKTEFPSVRLFLFVWLAYHIAMWTWKGTTLGGIVLGIKTVRQDGSALDFSAALVRALAGLFSAMPAFLGFFWAGWSREKQSWHDMIAGTVVVKVPKSALV